MTIKESEYANHKIYIVYQHEFQQYLVTFSDNGDMLKKQARPYGSSTKFVSYCPEEGGIILSRNYFYCPPIGELLSTKNDSVSLISSTKVYFDPNKYKTTIATYPSLDGTQIPIYIVQNNDYEKR